MNYALIFILLILLSPILIYASRKTDDLLTWIEHSELLGGDGKTNTASATKAKKVKSNDSRGRQNKKA